MGYTKDGELVLQACAGDREAYGELVTRYQGHVYGLGYSIVNNWVDAQDIAQETFIRLRELGTTPSAGSFCRVAAAGDVWRGHELAQSVSAEVIRAAWQPR